MQYPIDIISLMPGDKIAYIVAGPNGAGKTTFVKKFLPNYVEITNFVNADEIASGLSPFDSSSMNITSGKLMLELIDKYMEKGESFGFETTLAGKRWVKMIEGLKAAGYKVYIFFLNVVSVGLAVSRVKYRVESGGHNIPEETIIRRYGRSRANFWYNYRQLVDGWYLFENSEDFSKLIANDTGRGLEIISSKDFDRFLGSVKGE